MKKLIKSIYIICIFALLCIPVGFMHFYTAENTENRTLAERPSLITKDGIDQDFGEKFESYIADNFAFRDKLVNANSTIKAKLFGLSGNEKVTVGKDDWLFFTETLEDVTSKNTLTDREAFCAARTLEMINDHVSGRGGRFIFTIAPNKATLYTRYLPYFYSKSNRPNNMDKIVSRLENTEYFNIKSVFESTDDILYHKLDSHWNNKGALLVTNALLKQLGLKGKEYSEPEERQDWKGDLFEMLYPSVECTDTQYYYNEDEFDYSNTSRFKSVDDMKIATQSDSTNGSILLFRDSFGRSLYPFVADNFSKAMLSRSVPYDLTDMSYDYVVLEIVERNLEDIISRAPYMQAPAAETDIDSLIKLDSSQYDITVENKGLEHIYGSINTELSENTRIFVGIGSALYEAFPCYELSEEEKPDGRGNGFSLYTADNAENINIYISK